MWPTLKVKQLNHFLYKKDIQVNSDLNLGTISIENAKEIKEVVITGKKKYKYFIRIIDIQIETKAHNNKRKPIHNTI